MAIEPISLALIIVTMTTTIAHLILDLIKHRSAEKIDKTKLQLEQGKVGLEVLMTFFPQIKKLTDFDITDPEAIKEKIAEWEDLTNKLKEFNKEDNEDKN